MLKPWHIKALWFKAALQDVLLEGQKSLTAVQWQQMCSMWVLQTLVAVVPYIFVAVIPYIFVAVVPYIFVAVIPYMPLHQTPYNC
jgi:hypothetical protein